MRRMPWKRAFRDVSIMLVGFLVLFGLIWLFHGSFESVPTEEQQDKARIGALCWLVLTVPALAWCAFMRLQNKK